MPFHSQQGASTMTDVSEKRFNQLMDTLHAQTQVAARQSEILAECTARLSGIEATLKAQDDNIKTFWNTHWAGLMKQVESSKNEVISLRGDVSELRDEHSETRERLVKIETSAKAHKGKEKKEMAALAAGATGVGAVVAELMQRWFNHNQ